MEPKQIEVLNFIRKKGAVVTKDVQIYFGITPNRARTILLDLRREGKIEGLIRAATPDRIKARFSAKRGGGPFFFIPEKKRRSKDEKENNRLASVDDFL